MEVGDHRYSILLLWRRGLASQRPHLSSVRLREYGTDIWQHIASLPTLMLIPHIIPSILAIVLMAVALVWIWPTSSRRIIGVGLDMLLQVLGPLERLAAEFASMGLKRDMDTDVRGDVIALDNGNVAVGPTAGQVEVVGTLATDMPLADMFLRKAYG